jgi:hypothetical protein
MANCLQHYFLLNHVRKVIGNVTRQTKRTNQDENIGTRHFVVLHVHLSSPHHHTPHLLLVVSMHTGSVT